MNINHIFPIVKYNIDENKSFSYFRSYITFYYYVIFILKTNDKNSIKKEFIKYYKNDKYFDFFYSTFVVDKNSLIFTYFNNIPLNFFPYIKELYYYYPYVTFFKSKHFYKKGNIFFKEKVKHNIIFNEGFKISKYEIQTTIPIEYFKDFIKSNKSKNYYILLKNKNNFIISFNPKLVNNKVILSSYHLKNDKDKKYKEFNKKIEINITEITYISILFKITQKLFDKNFNYNIIKKGNIYYSNHSKNDLNINNIWFYLLYPKIYPFPIISSSNYNSYININCYRVKQIKNIKSLNLTIDIFYDNEILKDLIKNEYRYISRKDTNYDNYEINDIYRCVNKSIILKDRTNICNFMKKKFDFLNSKSWVRFYHNNKIRQNFGKNFLNLLIYKNKFITDYKEIYYSKFITNYGIKSFTCNYGYYFTDKTKTFYDTELFINNNLINSSDYFKIIDIKKGSCDKIYKKGLLINEKKTVNSPTTINNQNKRKSKIHIKKGNKGNKTKKINNNV
tara:strand:- start:1609 stop:3123 length:1515 start_codon:yes stop_codon:yes gene_type:complete